MMPAPAAYNESYAVLDTWLNQAVGCSTAKIEKWQCGPACEAVPTVERRIASTSKKHTFALVARTSHDECAVVFRGTKGFLNTLQDLEFIPKELPGCHAPSSSSESEL